MEQDGGWGWLVVAASFFIHAICVGITYSSGALYLVFIKTFPATSLQLSWVPACMMSVTALAKIPATCLVYLMGYRLTVLLGGLLAGGGLALTAITTKLYQVYLTMGLMTGFGFGLALTPSVMILDTYFYKKRDIAASIVVAGVSIGIFVFPLFIYHIYTLTDSETTLKFSLSGFGFIISICSIPFKCNKKPRQYKIMRMFECIMWKSPTFLCLFISNVLWSAGVSIIYLYLPSFAILKGFSIHEGIILVSLTGLSSFVSRSIYIILTRSTTLDHASIFINAILLPLILGFLFPELFKCMSGFIGYALMFGFHCGFWTTFIYEVVVELLGPQYVAYGTGFLAIAASMGLTFGAPVAAILYDAFGEYDASFYLAGSCICASAVLMFGLNIKSPYYRPPLSLSDSSSLLLKELHDEDENLLITARVTTL